MNASDLHAAAAGLAARLAGKAEEMRARERADVASALAAKTGVAETAWKARHAVELRARAAAAIAAACAELIQPA